MSSPDDRFRRGLWPFRTRARVQSDADDEIAFHLDLRTEELMAEGMTPDDAREQALREFGDVEEGRRDMERGDRRLDRRRRAALWLEGLRKDVGFAFRTLRQRPGFAAVTVATLALGLAAATAMFSVVDGILLQPLPVEDEDRVVVMWQRDVSRGFAHMPMPYAEVRDIRENARLLDGVAAAATVGAVDWTLLPEGDEPVPLRAAFVTGGFFEVLGVRPALGRLLRPDDDEAGAERTAVLSQGAWQRIFGADPDVVGTSIRLNGDGESYTIVGVAPAGFGYPEDADIWTPVVPLYSGEGRGPGGGGRSIFDRGGTPFFDAVVRMRPEATVGRVTAEAEAILAESSERTPAEYEMVARTLPEMVTGDVRPALLILFGGVGLLLLIAGVNVAGLLLIRGLGRRRELAVRRALGAGRGRIVRQLTTESLLLGLAGGVLGLLLANVALDGVLALAPPELPRADEVGLGVRAAAFAMGVAIVASLAFGLLPALSTPRGSDADSLRTGARAEGPDLGSRMLRRGLVVAQFALTLVVLAGAGLLIRSLAHLQSLDPGFATDDVVLARLTVPQAKYADAERYRATLTRVVERAEALPGIASVTPVMTPPFYGDLAVEMTFTVEGQSADEAERNPWLNYELASGDHFRTLSIEIVAGRPIRRSDGADAEPVVVVNETLARSIGPGEPAVDKRLKWGRPDSPGPWRRVVGVARDTRYRELRDVRPAIYVPPEQGIGSLTPSYLAVRAEIEPAAWVDPFRAAVVDVDPEMAVVAITRMANLLDEPLARPRFNTLLIGLLAALAAALSAVGIYGTIAFYVRQRTAELGIRMALGASAADLRRLVLRQAAVLGGAGIVLGLVAALAATRWLGSLLFEISPTDPVAFAGAAAVMLVIALLAAVGPARRASRADPAGVLRTE